jgi:hypothetical protein
MARKRKKRKERNSKRKEKKKKRKKKRKEKRVERKRSKEEREEKHWDAVCQNSVVFTINLQCVDKSTIYLLYLLFVSPPSASVFVFVFGFVFGFVFVFVFVFLWSPSWLFSAPSIGIARTTFGHPDATFAFNERSDIGQKLCHFVIRGIRWQRRGGLKMRVRDQGVDL